MRPAEALQELVNDTRNPWEARALMKLAAKALAKLPKDIDPALRSAALDQLLEHAPALVYAQVAAMAPEHRDDLHEALGRCEDVEARILVAADDFDEAARFVALIAGSSNCPLCAKRVADNAGLVTKSVASACASVFTTGYPRFSVAIAGAFAAVAIGGTPAQKKALFAREPPDDAILWLSAIAKKLPPPARSAVLERIAGRKVEYVAREDDEQPRFRPRTTAKAPPRKAPPPQRAPSTEALLAAVYAAPALDEPRAVYADALLEAGQPLGELIQLQLARAKGKRASLSKEKLLFSRHGAALWPDHPCVLAGGYLTFDDLDRGFPARLSLPMPVSTGKPDLPPAKVRAKLAGHPGWSTVRAVRDGWQDEFPLAELLPETLPLLERLQGLTLGTLDTVRTRSWPVTALELSGEGRCKAVTGLPAVTHVTFGCDGDLARALSRLEPTGLLSRATHLALWSDDTGLKATLAAAKSLPSSVRHFEVGRGVFRFALERGEGAPAAELRLESIDLEARLAELAALPPSAFSSLHVTLATNGFFTKKTRPVAEAATRRVLARFKNTKLTSVHPT